MKQWGKSDTWILNKTRFKGRTLMISTDNYFDKQTNKNIITVQDGQLRTSCADIPIQD